MSRIDVSQSIYHEAPSARDEFDRLELRRLRYLLRRMRFLETRIRETGDLANNMNGGVVHAELEMDALEFALDELGFLAPRDRRRK